MASFCADTILYGKFGLTEGIRKLNYPWKLLSVEISPWKYSVWKYFQHKGFINYLQVSLLHFLHQDSLQYGNMVSSPRTAPHPK